MALRWICDTSCSKPIVTLFSVVSMLKSFKLKTHRTLFLNRSIFSRSLQHFRMTRQVMLMSLSNVILRYWSLNRFRTDLLIHVNYNSQSDTCSWCDRWLIHLYTDTLQNDQGQCSKKIRIIYANMSPMLRHIWDILRVSGLLSELF